MFFRQQYDTVGPEKRSERDKTEQTGPKRGVLIVMAVIGAFVLAASVILGVTLRPKGVRAVIDGTPVLFKLDGPDQTTVNALSDLVATALGNNTTANVTAIKNSNGGSAVPSIQLFDSVTGSDTNAIFSKLPYRLMYVTKVTNNGVEDTVLTFWASQPYRNQYFRSANLGNDYNEDSTATNTNTAISVNGQIEGGTRGCLFRNSLTNDFHTFLTTNFTATAGGTGKFEYAANYIVRPAKLSWQTSGQADGKYTNATYNDLNNLLTGDRLNDLVWIPSGPEVGYTEGNNGFLPSIWGASATECGYTQNGFYSWSYLRSGCSYGTYRVRVVSPVGSFSYGSVYGTYDSAVRPALHLNLSFLALKESSIAAGFAPGSTTGNGAGVIVNN